MVEPSYYSGSRSIEWETPKSIFQQLDSVFSFTIDVCATPENTKCIRFFSKTDNGLIQSWKHERCFMNPPYGTEISCWVKKAYLETKDNQCALVVGLLPARTDTIWFHSFIYHIAEIRFLRGRVKFCINGIPQASSPFPSMIVIWSQSVK